MESRKYLLYNILNFLFVFVLYFIVDKNNVFLYTLSSSLYLILMNIFINFNLKDVFQKYKKLNYLYTLNKTYKYSFIFLFLVDIILIFLCLAIGGMLENTFKIENIKIVFLSMSISLVVLPAVNIVGDYLIANKYEFGKYLFNIFNIINFVFKIIILYLGYNIYKLPNCINISFIFYSDVITFILLYVIIYVRYIIKLEFPLIKKREEKKLKYKLVIVNSFIKNGTFIVERMLKYSYLYISIIFMFYILRYEYGYNYEFVSNVINVTYLYCFKIIYFVSLILFILYKNKLKFVLEKSLTINEFIVKYVNSVLSYIIYFIITSKYIWILLFDNRDGIGILMWCFIIVIFIVLAYLLFLLLNSVNKKKTLLIGLIFKLIITLPLVSSFYRLGYNLIYGDILSTVLSFLIMIIYSLIKLKKKYPIEYLYIFDNSLKIVYKNIILCLLLIVFQLILPFSNDNRFNSFLVIIIYTIFFIILKIGSKFLFDTKK